MTAPCILVVEDNPGDVMLIQHCLSKHDVSARLHVSPDGEEALKCVEELETSSGPYPDLVILDLHLPKVPGTIVLNRIRQSSIWDDIPVVVLTSSNSPIDREEAARLGANLYINKPARLDEYLKIGQRLKEFLPNERESAPSPLPCSGRT